MISISLKKYIQPRPALQSIRIIIFNIENNDFILTHLFLMSHLFK